MAARVFVANFLLHATTLPLMRKLSVTVLRALTQVQMCSSYTAGDLTGCFAKDHDLGQVAALHRSQVQILLCVTPKALLYKGVFDLSYNAQS